MMKAAGKSRKTKHFTLRLRSKSAGPDEYWTLIDMIFCAIEYTCISFDYTALARKIMRSHKPSLARYYPLGVEGKCQLDISNEHFRNTPNK